MSIRDNGLISFYWFFNLGKRLILACINRFSLTFYCVNQETLIDLFFLNISKFKLFCEHNRLKVSPVDNF